MSEQFTPTDSGWRLSGDVDYNTVVALREAGEAYLDKTALTECVCDFSGVGRVNTAALALLLCWYRKARALGVNLSYEGVPSELRGIAEMSDLSQLLEHSAEPASTP